MHNDSCGNISGLCDEMKPTKGEQLLDYLRKVEFDGEQQLRCFSRISFLKASGNVHLFYSANSKALSSTNE